MLSKRWTRSLRTMNAGEKRPGALSRPGLFYVWLTYLAAFSATTGLASTLTFAFCLTTSM
jgi:hypothetical protein